jgi:hypothetical protein
MRGKSRNEKCLPKNVQPRQSWLRAARGKIRGRNEHPTASAFSCSAVNATVTLNHDFKKLVRAVVIGRQLVAALE